jgi:hypothetical protein
VIGEPGQVARRLDDVFGQVVHAGAGGDLERLGAALLQSCAVVVVDDEACTCGALPLLRRLKAHCPGARCIWAAAGTEALIEAFNEKLVWRTVIHAGDSDELLRHVHAALLEWRQDRAPTERHGFLGC